MLVSELLVSWPPGLTSWPTLKTHAWVDEHVVAPLDELQNEDSVLRSFANMAQVARRAHFLQFQDVFEILDDWPWISLAWAHGAGLPIYTYMDAGRRAAVSRIVPQTWIEWDHNAGHFRILRTEGLWMPGMPRKLVATVGPDGPLVHEKITTAEHVDWLAKSTGRPIEVIRDVQTGSEFVPNPYWTTYVEDVV